MKHLGMAGTYVQIDRDELESWLNGLPHLTGKAQRVPGRAGVYVLPLSDFVGVRLSSTIGSSDDAVERGKASMQLALVSLITGQVLNKKAQGQSHFKRTVNWKTTWKEGIDRMREAYTKSQGFYDGVARIHDRNAYKADVLKAIDEIPNWQENGILSDFRVLVDRGGIAQPVHVLGIVARQVDAGIGIFLVDVEHRLVARVVRHQRFERV